jgi:predicted dehydrogenase
VKILIAGLGSVGQRHARNLRALLGGDLDLLAYRVRGLPQVITERMTIDDSIAVEQHYGITAFATLDEALEQRPSAVIVANPTRFHLPVAARALHAAAHVFIEKPIADSLEGVDELIACAARRRLVAAVGYQLRFHPAIARVREWLAGGRIGRVQQVNAEWREYLPDAHPYEDYRQSYAARADLGGGVLLSFSHEFDYLAWLFGPPRTVSATGGRSGELEVDVEDRVTITMTVERDGGVLPIELTLSFADRTPSRRCVIRGTAGSIVLDLRAPSVRLDARDGTTTSVETFEGFQRNDMFVAEMKNFLAAIAGADVVVPARTAAISLRMALAAKQSLASDAVVALP